MIRGLFPSGIKGSVVLGCAGILAFLPSCNLDEPENINTYTFETLNHIVTGKETADGSPEVLLTPSNYTFKINGTKRTLEFDCSDLLFNNANHTVKSGEIPYKSVNVSGGWAYGTVYSFKTDQGSQVSGAQGTPDIRNGQITMTAYPIGQSQSTVVMTYAYGNDMTVKTLRKSSYFVGETEVIPDAGKRFITNEAFFFLRLDNASMKATLAIGDLEMTDKLDMSVILTASDLPVTLTTGGYVIQTPKAVLTLPGQQEGSEFQLEDLKIETLDENLTQIGVNFTMTDRDHTFETKVSGTEAYVLF